jgi:D-3-phosphoglycerate dehydrogenase
VNVRILVAEPEGFSARAVEVLSQVGDVELRCVPADAVSDALRAYDVFWFRLGYQLRGPVLPERPRCRVLATPVTGLDHVDLDGCRARGIRVVSLRGETEFLRGVRATAELTVGLALALLRRIPVAFDAVRGGRWTRDPFRGRELFGKTAGIVGMGRLGTLVAGYLRAFGTDVVGYDPRPDFPAAAARRAASLDELLAVSDLVSVHVTYGPSTVHLIGPAQLAAMKPGTILVNTSRGGVVDDAAVLEALRLGRLAGAALDVLDGEPAIGADHPLVAYARSHDNLLIVPHIGGNTWESFEKTEIFLAGRVVEALAETGA